jgi:hypothetical protein
LKSNDKQTKSATDAEMPKWPNIFKPGGKPYKCEKQVDVQPIFDMDMELIQHFHIHTPSCQVRLVNLDQAIHETGSNNSPLAPPNGHTKEHPQGNDK